MTGVIRKAFYDAGERKFTFATFEDVEPLIEDNKRLQAEQQTNDELHHTFRVPPNVVNAWLAEEADKGNVLRWGSEECDLAFYKQCQTPEWKAAFSVLGPRHRVGFGS